ncbi:excalibur calcium-binding domain-containing protein [Erysipelothrix rhusiopathiae]|nr:excalibur calcium-binding domain-containing protein [Erysipelothrix rhusiopathiae]
MEKDTHVEAKWYAMHTEEKVVLNETPFENIEETDDSLLESESYQKQVGKIGIDETRKQLVYRDDSLYKESIISEKNLQPKTDAIWVKGTKPIPLTPTIQATLAVESVNQAFAKTEVKSEYYKNCTELRKVYPSSVGSDHAAYRLPLDRDRDGWACEAKGN